MAQTGSNKIQRRQFVSDLLAKRDCALVVPGLGSPTWDTFAAGDSPEYLYSWGGMGMAVPTALGLALAQPDKRILALTGDGEMMMGIGSLGVVANHAPSNLGILVLDNEHFGETGKQTGLTSSQADLCKVAEGFGELHLGERLGAPQLLEGQVFLVQTVGFRLDAFVEVNGVIMDGAQRLPAHHAADPMQHVNRDDRLAPIDHRKEDRRLKGWRSADDLTQIIIRNRRDLKQPRDQQRQDHRHQHKSNPKALNRQVKRNHIAPAPTGIGQCGAKERFECVESHALTLIPIPPHAYSKAKTTQIQQAKPRQPRSNQGPAR